MLYLQFLSDERNSLKDYLTTSGTSAEIVRSYTFCRNINESKYSLNDTDVWTTKISQHLQQLMNAIHKNITGLSGDQASESAPVHLNINLGTKTPIASVPVFRNLLGSGLEKAKRILDKKPIALVIEVHREQVCWT